MNVYLNIERTAHRDSSVIYLDRKPAINGQNDPTQASKIKKDENRMLKKWTIAIDDSANDESPSTTSNRGLK